MRRFAAIISLLASLLVVEAKVSPLSVKEIALMLRSGYPADAIEKDLATRHFIEPIDEAAEKALIQSGATMAFVASLKSGRYAVPASEVAAVQKEVDEKARRKAAMDEEAKKWNTLYQDEVAKSRAAANAAAVPASAPSVTALIKGDLVTSRNGILQTFNDQVLDQKKLIALYFSARWCPSCRKFTPTLVEFYNRIAAAHPEFEVVFISNDRSAPAMEAYMRDTQMPWPAVSFDKIKDKGELTKYAGSGIPCLVVIDAQGRVLADTYAGKTYRGPEKVLEELDQFFASGRPVAAAGR